MGRTPITEKNAGKATVVVVGAGRLANSLAAALDEAGFTITEIVARDLPRSGRRARRLAAKVGAQPVTVKSAALNSTLLWLCVPDREIRSVASALATNLAGKTKINEKKAPRFAFHSSGALPSGELEPLREAKLAVASVHPLMTFVGGPPEPTSMSGVPFALEGDREAIRMARRMIRALGGDSFTVPASRKAAYHAWATMSSPLLLAFLVTLEEVAGAAGFTRGDARRKSLPILRQTLANYARLGAARSFSGPLVRGDAKTVAKHLAALEKLPGARKVYTVLAQEALRGLPVENRGGITRLLRSER